MMDGDARNVSHATFLPKFPLTCVVPPLQLLRDQQDRFSSLCLWLSKSFVTDHLLAPINKIMQLSRKNNAKSSAHYRHQLTVAEFWIWLAKYFCKHLQQWQPQAECVRLLTAAVSSRMGIQRYKKISAALEISEQDIDQLIGAFNKLAQNVARHGSTLTIDETMLAYYGNDAKVDRIWRRIPEKPHAKGLIQWRGFGIFRHSDRRVILSIVPFLPSQRWTPTRAAEHIIHLARLASPGALHVFFDAGFATQEMFSLLVQPNVAYTACLKVPLTGPHAPLYAAACYDLHAGESRSIAYNGHIVQAFCHPMDADHQESYLTVVASDGYSIVEHDPIRHPRHGTYSAAVTDYLTCGIAQLELKYHSPNAKSKAELLFEKTGWDVLAPPPDDAGRQAWTEEGVKAMKKAQLAEVAAALHHLGRPVGSSKQHLVAFILAHHPHCAQHLHRPRIAHAQPAELIELYQQLGLQTSEDALLLTNFGRFKGAVDHSNEDLYRYIRLSGHKGWRALTVASVLHALVLNAWASHDEAVLVRAEGANHRLSRANLHAMRESFYDFLSKALLRAIEQ